MWKIIAFFNHKGWVGKTTLVHNLAFALSDEGKRILLIDTDPQMNLTAAMYGLCTSVDYSTNDKSIWMQNITRYQSLTGYFNQILWREEWESNGGNERFRSDKTKAGCIDMISGKIQISEYEAEFYALIASNLTVNTARSQIDAINTKIRKELDNYDFILIDTSPSSTSILNAIFIYMSDYMIAPVTPNFFSLQAIDNLTEVFANWSVRLQNVLKSSASPRWLDKRVKFLWIVIQMAKRFQGGGRRNMNGFSQSTERWADDLNESVKRFYQSAVDRGNSVTTSEFSEIFPNREPFTIEKCCDFTPKLKSVSELSGVPVIHITEDMCKTYAKKEKTKISIVSPAEGQYKMSFDAINDQYRRIAHNLINLL